MDASRPCLLLGALVALLALGLLGMHEMTVHDVEQTHVAMPRAPGPHAAQAAPNVVATSDHMGAMGAMGDNVGQMVTACLAVLTGLVVVALALAALVARVPRRQCRPGLRTSPSSWQMPNAPPPVWEFSVIRC